MRRYTADQYSSAFTAMQSISSRAITPAAIARFMPCGGASRSQRAVVDRIREWAPIRARLQPTNAEQHRRDEDRAEGLAMRDGDAEPNVIVVRPSALARDADAASPSSRPASCRLRCPEHVSVTMKSYSRGSESMKWPCCRPLMFEAQRGTARARPGRDSRQSRRGLQ